jgi:tetratricopeptide (TPR) repeat protein/glutathione synthase/RimK-type ligase-like ATP-grasp enzyme
MPATASANALPDVVDPLAARQLRIGLEHYGAGRTEEAIAAFQLGLAAVGNESPGTVSVETISELHSKLGNACMIRGDLESAGENYKAALRLAPHLTDCWCNFGNVHLKSGKPQDAIALYLQALKLNSRHWPARTNLVQALMATQQYIVARGLLAELISERPQDGQLRHQLGKVQFELNEPESALECFQAAVALNPRDAESINWIGGLKQTMGDDAGAQAAYAEAAQIQPLIRRPAAKSPPDFRVLALYAPFGGNTPTELLFKDAVHDTDTLALFAARDYDAELFSQNIQVVVNLISDADQTEALLPLAADLVVRLGKPTVNDPRKIQQTTRDIVATLLQGIPGCRVPKALRHKAGADASPAALQAAFPFSSPVLARPVGTHGGDDFEKIADPEALAAFLSQRPDHDHYLIEYIDYRSADGHFRKYRLIFVDGQILPYHLCIGSDWKLHHINTDMANQPWMQQEEEAFLNNPTAVLEPSHYQALQAIQHRVGLEYFGIDCGLDVSGNLVVFEVNASMLVHDRNEGFAYKTPAVHRIKLAFDAMLQKLATGDASGCTASS